MLNRRIVSIRWPTNNLWHQSLNFFVVIVIMMFSSRPSLAFIRHHPSLCSSLRLHINTLSNSQYLFATTSSRLIHTANLSSCNNKLSHALNSNTHQNEEDYQLTLTIPTPSDMEDIGALLSVNSNKGDVILLDGDLGAGKTCFSRGFIRAKTGCGDERVTSPTYLLSNMYSIASNNDTSNTEGEDMKIYHMDLYRLSGTNEDELQPLNLPQVFSNDISLIEWPSRLHSKPGVRLDVTLTIDSSIVQEEDSDSDEDEEEEDGSGESASRIMKLVPHGKTWIERLKFLEDEGYLDDLIM